MIDKKTSQMIKWFFQSLKLNKIENGNCNGCGKKIWFWQTTSITDFTTKSEEHRECLHNELMGLVE